MTIPYADSFSRALLQWRGSLYKAVWSDLLIFYLLYYIVMACQWWVLDESGKKWFNHWVKHCEIGTGYIPLTFLLGFFVAGIVGRWWEQFNWISWPDKLMTVVSMCLGGEKHRATRRTIARWSSLQAAIAWRMLSMRTKARFPTERHLVQAKLMTEDEHAAFTKLEAPYGKWFAPTIWIANLFRQLREKGEIDSVQMKIMLKQLLTYRDGFAMLMVYDWINIPLVYTQVVAIATYGYFLLCLIGRQPRLDEESRSSDATILFPIFTTLQLMFYIGWLKVGQYLMHPFGDDEDDFELNWILDRNIQTAYLIGDTISTMEMPVEGDPFGDQPSNKIKMPHTRASVKIQDIEPKDSLAHFKIKDKDSEYIAECDLTQALLDAADDENDFKRIGNRLMYSIRGKSAHRRVPTSEHGEGSGTADRELRDLKKKADGV